MFPAVGARNAEWIIVSISSCVSGEDLYALIEHLLSISSNVEFSIILNMVLSRKFKLIECFFMNNDVGRWKNSTSI